MSEERIERILMDAQVALIGREPEVDATVIVSGLEFGFVVDSYDHYPPSGRCAQLCETPEELYGYNELEYRITSIWCDSEDGDASYYNCQGDDLTVPDEIEENQLYNAILEWVREGSQ